MEEGDKFLEQYDGQTVDDLIQLQSTHRIDSIVLAFEAVLDSRKESGEKLSDAELTVLAVEAFERELNNGGFSQFFYNASVEYAPAIVRSLNAIGCVEMANLSQKAIDMIGVGSQEPDLIEEKINSDGEELEEALGELDDIFYDSEEVPTYALFEYIKNNRNSIKLSGKKMSFA